MSVIVSDNISKALIEDVPVVALETSVITNGLPKCEWDESFGQIPKGFTKDHPINESVATAMTNSVEAQGAVPAWIGVMDGNFHIGMPQESICVLAEDDHAAKASLSNLASLLVAKQSAGTTVAATLLGCTLANPDKPIRVFATGGIGGFHNMWSTSLDVSTDLKALATTPTCVVASGAKSILDISATVAFLETLGIPLLGLRCNRFPRFIEQHDQDDPFVQEVQTEEEIATICQTHWGSLQMKSAVLATVPVTRKLGISRNSLRKHIEDAESAWHSMKQPPATRTPFILNYLVVQTQGQSLRANVALLIQNASVAAKVACALYTPLDS